MQSYSLRLDTETVDAIKKLAEARKVRHTTLTRQLIRRALRHEKKKLRSAVKVA